jgi:hypothetical protein
MTSELPDLNHRLRQFAVAAEVLIEAYGDIVKEGQPRDPGLAAAAFRDVSGLVNALSRAGIDALPCSGADVNRLARREQVRVRLP